MSQQVNNIWRKARKSYWIRAGVIVLFNRLSVSLFGFASFYLLLRMLPQAAFGTWMLFISLTTVVELVKAGFIRNPLIKYYQQTENQAKVLAASLLLNLLMALLISCLLFISSQALSTLWHQPELDQLFKIYILSLLLLVPLHHFDYVQQANMSFRGSLLSEAARQGVFLLCIMVYYFADQPLTLVHLAYCQLLSIGVGLLLSFVLVRRYLQPSMRIEWQWVGTLFSEGKYTFGSSVSAMLMRNTDTWMLGSMMNPLAVAIYNPALRIANFLEIPALTLSAVLFPKLTRQVAAAGDQPARQLYEKSVSAILCCVLPVVAVVLVFAKPIVLLIAGDDYLQTVPILRLTVLYSLLLPLNRQLGVMLEAIGKASLNFQFVLRNMVLNVVFNYFFITRFGVPGAAYGTLLTYVISTVYNQIYLHRMMQVHLVGILHKIAENYIYLYKLITSQLKKPS